MNRFEEALSAMDEINREHYDYQQSYACLSYHIKEIREALTLAAKIESGEWPTGKMIGAGNDCENAQRANRTGVLTRADITGIFKAMIEARPK